MRVVVIFPGYGRCKFSLRGKLHPLQNNIVHFAVVVSVHTTPFSDRNGYLSIGVHTISQKRICFSLSDNEAFKTSDIGVFKLFRFWCSHYRVAFLFSSELRFCLAPFLFLSSFSFSSVFGVD